MFDGLDEVFDRATQSTVIDDIIRFAQQYPKAQVLITSRIVGYNPDRLQHAKFRHFTIQPLDTNEINEFIDRWYELSMGSDPDKKRLKKRLKDTIANSKAIQNLADNPLLLTMMTILNRRQELPRDRADLYEQASRVLLYHWDVDHKRLQLPMDAIGRREKQEMLRAIAYEMQAGDEGLKGNLISADRLTLIVTNYLREQGFSEPREKASHLIQQLRERNFILCYRGADTYGFVHRTFLEYFCAVEIVNRFEKRRTLTFEQLRDNVFGYYWQDEAWREVLKLISGMLDTRFIKEIIDYLVARSDDDNDSVLIIAAICILEVKNNAILIETSTKLFHKLKKLVEYKSYMLATRDSNLSSEKYLKLLTFCTHAVLVIPEVWTEYPDTLSWIKRRVQSQTPEIRGAAITALARFWRDELETLPLLKSYALKDEDWEVKVIVIQELAKSWNQDLEVLEIIKNSAERIEDPNVQQVALQELARRWKNEKDTLSILIRYSKSTKCFFGVRSEAIKELAKGWSNETWMFDFLYETSLKDPFVRKHDSNRNPRLTSLKAILTYYSTHRKTWELLHDRATNDPDEQLREWAQEQLKMQNDKLKMEDTP
ncbi:hypothetical protein QUA40_07080 [Microcoleus sp. Pol11C3]|uniref:HEAT repeat domain-containing protein n=1 Tax=Microcoleus sp. Pol11C3 TaxID=3055390 RepID=UPI002FD43949